VSSESRSRALRAIEESQRQVTGPEAAAYLATPISEAEREEVVALIRWFRRRYPTGADRLAYVRRAYRRWTMAERCHAHLVRTSTDRPAQSPDSARGLSSNHS
jgi:hypothetical protein